MRVVLSLLPRSLPRANPALLATWWSLGSRQAGCSPHCSVDNSLHQRSPPTASKAPGPSCSQTADSELTASPGAGEGSTSTQAASCTCTELQSPPPWFINQHNHACFLFSGSVSVRSPPTLFSCLLGIALSCHFQGGLERGGK